MKTEIITPKTFQPVTIALTFETQAELDALACMTNVNATVTAISQVFGRDAAEAVRNIRQCIHSAGGESSSKWLEFAKLI